jgi:hypothetical protein
MTTKARPLYEIAREIRKNWNTNNSGTVLSPYARPYLEAMETLDSINDRYFLGNATSWKGDTARRIKKELNAMLK